MKTDPEYDLAVLIADRLLHLSGTNVSATIMTPSIPQGSMNLEIVGGSYCRSELIDAIHEVVSRRDEEYRKVAAVVCEDMELLYEMSENSGLTLDELKSQVKLVRDNMKEAQENPVVRNERFAAMCYLWSIVSGYRVY